tara:strand:- start:230 stop:1126 length:897 start_codon:yes stop_codon:yes gene_type:complete
MKILITGALGYIGTELLFRLANKKNIEIYAIDNSDKAIKTRLGFLLRYKNIHFINADVTIETQVLKLPKVDLIIHLAAIVGYNFCDETPDLARLTNILGTYNVVQLNTPIVFLSTGSVYGEIGKICNEDVKVNPKTLYAETKIQGEKIVQTIDHIIFRPATAFGLSFKVRHDLLCHNLSQDAVNTGKINLYQPDAKRSFYSVQKLAELCEYAIDNFSLMKNEIYNVGCKNGNVTKEQMVNIIKQEIEFELTIIDGKDKDTRDYNVEYNKLKHVWPNLEENFNEQLKLVIAYYKQWKQQ